MSNLCFGISIAPYRVDYYNYLHSELGFEIFFLQRGSDGQLFDSSALERDCKFEQQYLQRKKILGCFHIYLGLWKMIRDRRPEVVITPEFSILTLYCLAFRLLTGCRYKVISQCDDSYDMLNGGSNFSKMHVLSRKLLVPIIDDLILVDKRAVDWYKSRYNKGRWMPIIKDESRICEIQQSLPKCISEKNEDSDKLLTLIFVARMIEIKNLPVLLEACSKLEMDYSLLVVGDGIMRKRWESLAADLNVNAVFTGPRTGKELDELYRYADVFVLPSIMEPFGAVTNEALLNGCVCVVSRKAGSLCLIAEGVNGYGFDPYSVDELVDAIRKAATLARSTQRKNRMTISFKERMQDVFCLSN